MTRSADTRKKIMNTENEKKVPATGGERVAVKPRVDVYESEAEYLVVADLPGVASDAVDVKFEGGELRLEAPRAGAPPQGGILAQEYRVSDFRRSFAMPEGVDAEKIEAQLSQGVLTVRLPKSSATRPRRIEVRAS